MIDTKAPVLKRFVLPTVVDIGKGAQAFRIEAEGDDGEGGSGLGTVSVWLDKQMDVGSGDVPMLQFGYIFEPDGFGDDSPNAAIGSYTLRDRTPVGAYTVTAVWLTDKAGNVAKYDTAQLQAFGMNTSLSVTGRPPDATPPALTGLHFPASVDLGAGPASLPVQVDARDEAGGEGLRMVTLWLDQPLVAGGQRYFALIVGNYLSEDDFRDATPQRAIRNFALDSATAPGTYRITRATLEDRAGNMRDLDADQLEDLGVSTSFTVTGGLGDTRPAELLDLWLPRTVSVKPGAQNAMAVSVRDPAGGKGVASVIVEFDRELSFSRGDSDTMYVSVHGDGDSFADATPNFGVDRFKLTEASLPGTYKVASVLVFDQAGNYTSYAPEQLLQRGINTTMTVVDRPAAASALPSLVDGKLVVSLSSPDWAAAGEDAFALALSYDGAKLGLVDATVVGAPGARLSASVALPGRLTLTGHGDLPADAVVQVVLTSFGGPSPFEYAVESFEVNAKAQVFGAGNLEYVRFGTAGADLLTDTGLSGLIEGLGGRDTVVFAGSRASYTVSKSGSGFVASHEGGERISLSGIERLSFGGDQYGLGLALDVDGVAGQAYRLYQAAFDRAPDAVGISFWIRQMDAGMSLGSVAQSFLRSAEFEGKYGAKSSDEAFLAALYGNVLHRAADPEGHAFWLKALKADFDRAELLALFSESPENMAQVIGSIENGFSYYA